MQQLESRSLKIREARSGGAPAGRPDSAVELALAKAREHLWSLQRQDGHWCGELEGDSILESEYLLLLHFLGRTDEPRARKAAEHLRRLQRPAGGWTLYPDGPPDVSASVKAYFVLKLQGDPADAAHMEKARRVILDQGGLAAVNTYTKTYLAIFGQYPWGDCPAIPPEIVLFPRWFYFDLYEMSSWSRAIFVPLSVIWANKPYVPVPETARLDELWGAPSAYPSDPRDIPPRQFLWRLFFYGVDQGLKLWEASRLRPFRERALEVAESWILERLEDGGGLGAIFPGLVNSVMALICLGYEQEHPLVQAQLEELHALEIDEGETLRMQPCLSPVWDTAQAVSSLTAAGASPEDPRLQRAARWLLDKEVRRPGDWYYRNPEAEVSGWYFEYANEFYPDCDDTAEVLTALGRVRFGDPDEDARNVATRKRALSWLLSMQNDDGGWAAFDKGVDKQILSLVPFADHNAMLDPSCEDITGRVLETLADEGFSRRHPAVERAVRFLRSTQQDDGTWYGRWGANYVYGTWLVLWGLARIGEDMEDERYQQAARWLRSRQNEDGGWGESLASYDDPNAKGRGTSTAAQTAWALLALFATGDYHSETVRRGVAHLLETQRSDGSWRDEHWTGTGFPRVFYLRYDYYDDYFPLLALGTYYRGPDGWNRTRSMPRAVS